MGRAAVSSETARNDVKILRPSSRYNRLGRSAARDPSPDGPVRTAAARYTASSLSFIHYSYATYLESSWRGAQSPFPVCEGGTLQAPLYPVPRKYDAHQRNHKGNSKENPKETRPPSYSPSVDAKKDGVARNRGCSSPSAPTPRPPPSAPLPNPPLPEFPLRRLTLRPPQPGPALPHPWWRGSLVPPGCTSSCPQGPLLGLPPRTDLKKVVPRLRTAQAPPALSSGSCLHLVQVLLGEAVTRLQLVTRTEEPLGAIRNRSVRLLPARHLVLLCSTLM